MWLCSTGTPKTSPIYSKDRNTDTHYKRIWRSSYLKHLEPLHCNLQSCCTVKTTLIFNVTRYLIHYNPNIPLIFTFTRQWCNPPNFCLFYKTKSIGSDAVKCRWLITGFEKITNLSRKETILRNLPRNRSLHYCQWSNERKNMLNYHVNTNFSYKKALIQELLQSTVVSFPSYPHPLPEVLAGTAAHRHSASHLCKESRNVM